jgi:hypothetical protein
MDHSQKNVILTPKVNQRESVNKLMLTRPMLQKTVVKNAENRKNVEKQKNKEERGNEGREQENTKGEKEGKLVNDNFISIVKI